MPPAWERWNDYGIGLLLEGASGSEKGELRQAADAFAEVERLGHADGPLNLARVFYKEGRIDEAADALHRAAAAGAPPWTVAWLSGLVNKENGFLDEAIADFTRALAAGAVGGRPAAIRFQPRLRSDQRARSGAVRARKDRTRRRARRCTARLPAACRRRVREDARHRRGKRDRPLRAQPHLRRAWRRCPQPRTRGAPCAL